MLARPRVLAVVHIIVAAFGITLLQATTHHAVRTNVVVRRPLLIRHFARDSKRRYGRFHGHVAFDPTTRITGNDRRLRRVEVVFRQVHIKTASPEFEFGVNTVRAHE